MKTIFKTVLCIAICSAATFTVKAQFQQIQTTGVYETDTLLNQIGIGNFGNVAGNVHSILHIDGNRVNIPTGEVFRTDAPNNTIGDSTYWRMYHGGTQVFNINNPYNTNNVSIGTVQAGHLNFFTNNSSSPRMTIIGSSDSTDGFVGIGTVAPLVRLDVIDSTTLLSDPATITQLVGLYDPAAGQISITGRYLSSNPNAKYQFGMIGRSANNQVGTNVGVMGIAVDTATTYNDTMRNTELQGIGMGSNWLNFGVSAIAEWTPASSECELINDAVHASAKGSPFENRSGTFRSTGTNGRNYAVWGRSTHGDPPAADDTISPKPRWGLAPKEYAGYFLGDVFVLVP